MPRRVPLRKSARRCADRRLTVSTPALLEQVHADPARHQAVPQQHVAGAEHVPQPPQQADLALALAGVAADAQVEDRPARQRDDRPRSGRWRSSSRAPGCRPAGTRAGSPACRAWRPSSRRTGRRGGPSRATAGRPARPGSARRGGPRRRRTARAGASAPGSRPPSRSCTARSPCATRWAIRRATAARQDWSALRTWPRKTQRVTSGEKIRSIQPADGRPAPRR